MRRFFILCSSAVFFLNLQVSAQTLADIINRHNEAVGGLDAWKRITSLKYTGVISSLGQNIPFTRTIVDGKGLRYDMMMSGKPSFIIYTQTQGWSLFGSPVSTKPTEMSAELVKETQPELYVSDPLVNYISKGARVTYLGMEALDRVEKIKLLYADRNGKESFFYLDPLSYYIVCIDQKITRGGKTEGHMQYLSRYTRLPEGIVVAMEARSENDASTSMNKVEVNSVFDEDIFRP